MELLNDHCVLRAHALLRALATEHPHASYEELEALAEGRLVVRAIFAAHIRECAICSNELRDLQAFVHSFAL